MVLFGCGLFSSICRHWLENEWPPEKLIDFVCDRLLPPDREEYKLIYMKSGNIGNTWEKTKSDRGSAWIELMENDILCHTNKNRMNKYGNILEYITELDGLYREIYNRIGIRKMQIDSSMDNWRKLLNDIFSFAGIPVKQEILFACGGCEGSYCYENLSCGIKDLGYCIQIKDIFGDDTAIRYLYSRAYPVQNDKEIWFELPSFGRVNITFKDAGKEKLFSVNDACVHNDHFRQVFEGLLNTKWVKNSVA